MKINPNWILPVQVLIQNVASGCATLFNSNLAETLYEFSDYAAEIPLHDHLVAVRVSCFGGLKILVKRSPMRCDDFCVSERLAELANASPLERVMTLHQIHGWKSNFARKLG